MAIGRTKRPAQFIFCRIVMRYTGEKRRHFVTKTSLEVAIFGSCVLMISVIRVG
jgi:hypothetical protein